MTFFKIKYEHIVNSWCKKNDKNLKRYALVIQVILRRVKSVPRSNYQSRCKISLSSWIFFSTGRRSRSRKRNSTTIHVCLKTECLQPKFEKHYRKKVFLIGFQNIKPAYWKYHVDESWSYAGSWNRFTSPQRPNKFLK